ncbi:MAG: hypothetical protein JSV37_05315 [Anaerolineaceae bacterium]|nr:MAG: hypothetical protein JSV37_05315 [Anaerolineaceae bacterium]
MVESRFVDDPLGKAPVKPIGVLAAFVAGFDRVAAKPILILPPLVLDLFLWFGPHLTLPFLAQMVPDMLSALGDMIGPDSGITDMTMIQLMLTSIIERYNVMSALSSFPWGTPFNLLLNITSIPAGLPSVMAGLMPVHTPLGQPYIIPLGSLSEGVTLWVVLITIGLGLGVFYHRWLAQQTSPDAELLSGWQAWGRMVLLFLAIYFGGFLVLMVSGIMTMIIGLLMPFFSGIVPMLLLVFLFWVTVYFAFTTHGIVLYRFRVVKAMLESARVVRLNLLSSIGFLFICFIITWFGSQIWIRAGEETWYSLLGLVGHAFVSTTLIAASYIFYQSRRTWLLNVQASLAASAQGPVDGDSS